MSPEMLTLFMFGSLLVGLFMGHPLAFVLGAWLGPGANTLGILINNVYGNAMDNYVLVAIPLFILMASYLPVSVGALFAGALVPGLLLGVMYAFYVLIICHVKPSYGPLVPAAERAETSTRELLVMLAKYVLPPMSLILGVLGALFTGIVLLSFPIMLPIIENMGIDVLWFVVMVAVVLVTGLPSLLIGY